MTDQPRTLRNFVDGEHVDAADGRTTDLVDPSTGEVVRHGAGLAAADVDARRWPRPRRRSRPGATPRPAERQQALLRIADAIEARADELVAAEAREHRQAARR